MSKKLKLAQEQAEVAIKETNKKIEELGNHTVVLYDSLNALQEHFDKIRNMPSDKKLEYEMLQKIRMEWKQQAEKIEADYKQTTVKTAGKGAAGVGAGVAVVTMGPTAAMGVATTFGVASTGTAISSLSGAAATNAALAWLGGGALSAGGGGMAAGEAFLALAGPVGWAIAGIALLGSGIMFFKAKSDQKRLENVFCLISERDKRRYELARVELSERIIRIIDENEHLGKALEKTISFGTEYNLMTEAQQYELGSYVNLMSASTQLLVNPIMGLKPNYTQADLDRYISSNQDTCGSFCSEHKELMVSMCNLLYGIEMDETDKKLLSKSFRKNKKFLASAGISKKEFKDSEIVFHVCEALNMLNQTVSDTKVRGVE